MNLLLLICLALACLVAVCVVLLVRADRERRELQRDLQSAQDLLDAALRDEDWERA